MDDREKEQGNMDEKKVMLSGIQPSGDLHLGNYLGAIKNWAERAEQFECYYFMADMHTITVRQNPADLRRRTLEQLAQYIACGPYSSPDWSPRSDSYRWPSPPRPEPRYSARWRPS